MLGQASTFRKALSPGQHAITLWVSDRNGTSDAHTIIIQVGDTATGWPFGLTGGLALLGLLLGLSGARRSGLTLILSGILVFSLFPKATDDPSKLGVAFPVQAQVLEQPLQGGAYNFWPDQGQGKLQLTVSFPVNRNTGMELRDVFWTPQGKNSIRYLLRALIPYIEIKPQGQAAIKVEIPNPPKFSQLSKLANPICGSRLPGLWGVTDVGRQLEAHYDLVVKDAQGQKLGTVNLVFDFRFYHPSWCRNSRAPEFYPEVRYTVQGFQVEKVRVPFRFDIDMPDINTKELASKNDVAMMVREPLTDVIQFGHVETSITCSRPGSVVIRPGFPPPNRGGAVMCVFLEFMLENFDNYHQAEGMIIAPSCHRGQPCFHFHMLKPALGHKFLAVQWHMNEIQPKEPEGLRDTPPEKLDDIVFWYIAESDKPQDSFAADRLMWPAQFVGFSCDIQGKPFGYPVCE